MSKEITVKDNVLREFLKDPSLGPSEMAPKINEKYNSVKAAFAKLAVEGYLERASRGVYEPNISTILLDLINRVEALEEQVKK
jgi:hypothetical protein